MRSKWIHYNEYTLSYRFDMCCFKTPTVVTQSFKRMGYRHLTHFETYFIGDGNLEQLKQFIK